MDFSRARPNLLRLDSPLVQVQRERRLSRLLAFAGWTIDDVVNSPIAKRDMVRWFKTDRNLHRRLEVIELEKQWNPLR